MRKTVLLVLPIVLVAASGAFAQVDLGLDDLDSGSPFKLSCLLDRKAAKPGGNVLVAVTFDMPAHHKVYRDDVKVTFPRPLPAQVASAEVIRIPEGKTIDDPFGSGSTRVFTGGEAVILRVTLADDASGTVTLKVNVALRGCAEEVCFPPETRTLRVAIPVASADAPVERINPDIFKDVPVDAKAVSQTPPSPRPSAETEEEEFDFGRLVDEKGLLVALPVAFGWGVLVSLTPCVYPLIPIVLAVVGAGTAGAGWKRGLGLSLIYVVGLSLTYAALGGVAGAVGDVTQTVATNPWVVGFVSVVFVALALSMFGLYDISIPSSIAGRLQKKRGGFAGILIMGVLSGLVAGPCVSAPLLALMVGVASKESIALGALAGAFFGLGMGAILVVAGTSSKALAALPRSGGWMVSVKRFFGWVMLGGAIYFAQPLIGFVMYETLLGALLIVAAFFMGIMDRTGLETSWAVRVRQGLGVLVLVAGLMYFVSGAASLLGFEGLFDGGEHAEPIAWETDVDAGLKRAREENRPAFVDLWADWCDYCREMDRTVFRDPRIVEESRRFVMIKADGSDRADRVRYEKQLGISGAPSFLFVPTEGDNRIVNGRRNAEQMLRLMRETR